jgi:hypothetical protein
MTLSVSYQPFIPVIVIMKYPDASEGESNTNESKNGETSITDWLEVSVWALARTEQFQ